MSYAAVCAPGVPHSARDIARCVQAIGATHTREIAFCYNGVWHSMMRVADKFVFARTDVHCVNVLDLCITRKELLLVIRTDMIEPLRHLIWCVRELLPAPVRLVHSDQHCLLKRVRWQHARVMFIKRTGNGRIHKSWLL